MGFLTRFIASGIEDDTARAEALAKHVKKVTGKCDSLYVRVCDASVARVRAKDVMHDA